MIKQILFGQYLVKKGLHMEAVISARLLQRRHNGMIGELAKDKGWLTYDTILRVLIMQEETGGKVGEIAVKENCLTKEQLASS
jgi:hypothetical protein